MRKIYKPVSSNINIKMGLKLYLVGIILLCLIIPSISAPTVTLVNEGDTDVKLDSPTTNFASAQTATIGNSTGFLEGVGRFYIQFASPNVGDIYSSTASLTLYQSYDSSFGSPITKIYSLYNKTNGAPIGSMTWNSQPCGTSFNNDTNCNLTALDTKTYSSTLVYNLTNYLTPSLLNNPNNAYFPFIIKTQDESTKNYISIRTSGSFFSVPVLSLTYTPFITINQPTANQMFVQENSTAIFNITTAESMSSCVWSVNNGSTNYTLNNQNTINEQLLISQPVYSVGNGWTYNGGQNFTMTADRFDKISLVALSAADSSATITIRVYDSPQKNIFYGSTTETKNFPSLFTNYWFNFSFLPLEIGTGNPAYIEIAGGMPDILFQRNSSDTYSGGTFYYNGITYPLTDMAFQIWDTNSSANWSAINTTMTEGTHSVKFYCNKSSDGSWVTSDSVSFKVNSLICNVDKYFTIWGNQAINNPSTLGEEPGFFPFFNISNVTNKMSTSITIRNELGLDNVYGGTATGSSLYSLDSPFYKNETGYLSYFGNAYVGTMPNHDVMAYGNLSYYAASGAVNSADVCEGVNPVTEFKYLAYYNATIYFLPNLTITNPVVIYKNASSIIFNISSNAAPGNLSWCGVSLNNQANMTMTLNSTKTGAGVINSSIADGQYNFTIFCNTTSNILASKNSSFIIDTTYPLVDYGIGTAGDGANLSQTNIYINVSYTEINYQNLTLRMYREPNNVTVYFYDINPRNITELSLGFWHYNVTICDKANNCNTTATRKITLDNINPNATLLLPTNNYYSNNSDNNFTANITDNLGIQNATLNIYNSSNTLVNSTPVNFASNIVQSTTGLVVNLIEGIYNWFYKIFDWAGNSYTTGNYTLNLDLNNISFCHNIDVAGTYYLDTNITATGTCFNLTTDNIIIDCQNNSITGPASGTNYGIYSNGNDGITIRNCHIKNFQSQIYLLNGVTATLSNNNLSNSAVSTFYGIRLSDFNSTTITSNTIRSNPASSSYGLYQSDSYSTSVYNSTITSNTGATAGYGVYSTTSGTLTIIGSQINSNTHKDIYLNENSNDVVQDTVLTNVQILGSISTSTNNIFLNTSETSRVITGSAQNQLIKKWYVNLNSSNSSGPIEALFKIWDSTGSLLFNGYSTPGDGTIPEQEIIEFIMNSSGVTYKTPHTINVSATDYNTNSTQINLTKTNNTNIAFVLIKTDVTPPNIQIVYPTNTNYSSVSELNYTTSDSSGLLECKYTLNGGVMNTTITCGNNETGLTATAGWNTWTVYAQDTRNNINSSSITFFIDGTNPNITLLNPPNNNYSNNLNQNFSANFSDNLGLKNYTLNIYNDSGIYNQTSGTFTGLTNVIGLIVSMIDNVYTWFFDVFDVVGNHYTSENRTLTIDTISPGISIVYPTNTNYSSVSELNYTIQLNASECWYTLNNGVTNTTITCGNNETGLTPTEGTNTWKIYAKDLANNVNSSSISFYYDSPTISSCRNLVMPNVAHTLNQSLSSTTTCLNVQAENVTINGNGFTIDGDSGTTDYGIYSIKENTTVRNITTKYFAYGIYFNPSNNSLIDSVTAFSNTLNGIRIRDSFNSIVKNSNMSSSSQINMRLVASFNTLIENNTFEGATTGFSIYTTTDNTTFVNNVFNGDSTYQIYDTASGINNKMIYNNSYGQITWTSPTTLSTLTVTQKLILGSTLNITDNFLDFDGLGYLNSAANITLYGIGDRGFVFPAILKDGSTCTDCYNFTNLTAETIVFNVTGFSNYSIGEDTVYPTLNIVFPVNNNAYDTNTLDLNYTVSDNNLDSCWWRNETGQNITIICGTNTTLTQSEGMHTAYMWANDTQGHVTSAQVNYTISTSSPAIIKNSPTNNKFFNSGLNLLFNVTAIDANNIDTCQLWGNWSDWHLNQSKTGIVSGTPFTFDLINLSEGIYIWNSWCNDTSGNGDFSATNYTFTIDTTYPLIEFGSGTQGDGYNQSSSAWIYINVSYTEQNFNNITFKIYNATGSLSSSETYGFTLAETSILTLSNGIYYYNVTLCDLANNCNSTDTRRITIDTDAPEASLIYPENNVYNNSASQNFTVNITDNLGIQNATLKIYNSTNSLINSTVVTFASNTIQSTLGIVVSLIDGLYSWFYQIFDWAGNSVTTDSRNITLDTTLPSISIVFPQNNSWNNNHVGINYTISDTNTITCEYSSNGGVTNTTLTCGTNITGTWNQGQTNLSIYSVDIANNFNSALVTFYVDTVFPQINFTNLTQGNNTYLNSNSIYIQINVTENNTDTITFNLFNDSGIINTTSYTSTYDINWAGLANGVYYYNATVNDSANNINSTETRKITLDSVSPNLIIITPLNQSYTTSQIILDVNSTETMLEYWYTLDNGATNTSFSDLDPIIFEAGSNVLKVYGKDLASNINNATVTFYVTYTNQLDVTLSTNPASPEIGSNVSLRAVTVTDNTDIIECNFSLKSPTAVIYNNVKGTGTTTWQSADYYHVLTSGNYTYNVTCLNEFGTSKTASSSFYVDTYNLTINEPYPRFDIQAKNVKTEEKNVKFQLYDNVASTINYTVTVVIDNPSNFTITYPSSFILNSSDTSTNPKTFNITFQAGADTNSSGYYGNVTLNNTLLNQLTVIPFLFAVNPPSAIPRIWDSTGSNECVGVYGGTCSINLASITQGASSTYVFYSAKTGNYLTASNCSVTFSGTLNQNWITASVPKVFDLDANIQNHFNITISPTSSTSATSYSGLMKIRCNQSDSLGFASDSDNAVKIDIQVVTSGDDGGDEGGGGGGPGQTPQNITNETIDLFRKGICGNYVCEDGTNGTEDWNENYNSCPVDCPGDLSPLTDCFNGGPNCIFKKATAVFWIGGFVLLILFITSVIQIKKKSGGQKYSFLPLINLDKNQRNKSYYG